MYSTVQINVVVVVVVIVVVIVVVVVCVFCVCAGGDWGLGRADGETPWVRG